MKIVNVLGGLGNQLFQYAFAVALQQEFPKEIIKINTKCFMGYPLHNGFELDKILKINLPQATLIDLCKVAYPWIHYRLWQAFHRWIPLRSSMITDKHLSNDFSYDTIANKSYFDGYWQSEKFFSKHRKTILKEFQFPSIRDERNLNVLKKIKLTPTAFIHVRRGDYIDHPVFGGICTIDYYKSGIKKLKNEYHYNQFLIFSNDISWCKENFKEVTKESSIIYVDWNSGKDSYRDIQLMSSCNAGIIANSSFSWWGAWLSQADIIIAPSKWTNKPGILEDIIPQNWIKI